MKKITLFLACLVGVIGITIAQEHFPTSTRGDYSTNLTSGQNITNTATVDYKMPVGAKSFNEFIPSVSETVPVSKAKATVQNQKSPLAITTFSDRATFEAAYTGTFVTEDFAGGPGAGAITLCGAEVSSTGDGCFPAGELEDGFNITASSGGDVIYIGAGSIGNTSTLMGANTFVDFTIINFEPDGAYAVGHDLYFSDVMNADYRVFDTGGNLLDSFTVTIPANTETFFGIISDSDAIGRVEIQAEADAGELFGNFEFGLDPPGGGGSACSEMNPSNGFENGFTTSSNTSQIIAADLTVPADKNMSLTTVTTNFLMPDGDAIVSADITVYGDAAGFPDPGNIIESQLAVAPSSQTVLGDFPANPILDVSEVVFDLSPVMLDGQTGSTTTYWISVYVTTSAAGNGYWEDSSATVVGNGAVFSTDGVTWNPTGGGEEMVYVWDGDCSDILGVSENALSGFAYYPNPATDVLSLKSASTIDSVSIYNLLGQRMMDVNIGTTTSEINISALSTGTYIMKVSVDGEIGTFKVLKN